MMNKEQKWVEKHPCESSMFAIVSDAATGVTILIAGIPLIFPMHSMLQPSPTALRR